MIKQRDLRRFQARYHRNGVAGEGFHLCSFLYLRGKDTVALQAVVFDDPGRVAVIKPDDIQSRWRGDDFEQALREAIVVVENAQPESIHAVA
jgi:hypothetical protein